MAITQPVVWCSKCHKSKPYPQFVDNKGRRRMTCDECRAKRQRYREARREQEEADYLARRDALPWRLP